MSQSGSRATDRMARWSRERWPAFHRFLTSDEPKTVKRRGWARDIGVFALILLIGGSMLWGLTGQPFPEPPVVVIESGSMMQCSNIRGVPDANHCEEPLGRLGIIDPGDLIFVKNVEGRSDVGTYASGGPERYNMPGDVIVYYPGGDRAFTPIIHRAMLWLEIEHAPTGDDGASPNGTAPNGTDQDTGSALVYNIPTLGLHGLQNLSHPVLNDAPYRISPSLHNALEARGAGPEDSGFITLGDNNLVADQGGNPGIGPMPVQPDWILGKARGELPWIGVAKLFITDFTGGAGHFARAPSDSKWITFGIVAALVVGPWLMEKRAHRREQDGEAQQAREQAAHDAPQADEDAAQDAAARSDRPTSDASDRDWSTPASDDESE